MKRLWKYITPCYSDVFGFLSVINHSDGFAIVDDSSKYKNRHKHNYNYFDSLLCDQRNVSTHIKESDVICGTKEKVLEAYRNSPEIADAEFLILTSSPCSSMINTDYQEICDLLQSELSIPVGYVLLDGQKDYLYGISSCLELMGKMLLVPKEKSSNGVNILGCNLIDFQSDEISEIEYFLQNAGFNVLSKWGCLESVDNLKEAVAASVNLVINVSGLKIAEYMKREFGIPYVVGCPVDQYNKNIIIDKLKSKNNDLTFSLKRNNDDKMIVIVGEQVLSNSIRESFINKGFSNIIVCSFFEMDKTLMKDGDIKLNSEDELIKVLDNDSVFLVCGEDDISELCNKSVFYLSLPNTMKVLSENFVYFKDIENELSKVGEV
ncbi:MAG: nitrogenase component 1 [Candidatus Coprovivens sp.]